MLGQGPVQRRKNGTPIHTWPFSESRETVPPSAASNSKRGTGPKRSSEEGAGAPLLTGHAAPCATACEARSGVRAARARPVRFIG